MPVMEIESTGQLDEILAGNVWVLVDFYATWCGPCRAIAPEVEALAKYNPKVKFVKVNADKHPELMRRYKITAMPTFLKFNNGQLRGDPIVGADLRGLERAMAEMTL